MKTTDRKMNAVRLHRSGGTQELVFEQVPRPRPGSGEVLVRVIAAAISPAEFSWLGEITKPIIPSHEMSGVVEEVGSEVADVRVGDQVYGLPDFGGDGAAADYAVIRVQALAPKPRSIDHVGAAAMPLSALTAWQALRVHGAIASGQRVLIHGGAGGVGSYAVQLARHFGAETIATASRTNAEFVSELGADRVIDYGEQQFDSLVSDVDLVLDTVGGKTLERSWNVLKRGGALISVAEEPSQERAASLGVRAIYFIVEPNRAHLIELAKLADAGHLRPIVSKTFPLSHAREAYEFGSRGHMRGKIVLNIV